MKLLHIQKSPPDDVTRMLIETLSGSADQDSTAIKLDDATDYDELIDLIFAHDRVISWW